MAGVTSGNLLNTVLLGGIGLAIGGLVVGSLFYSAAPGFTDAFGGLNTSAGSNITSTVGAVGGIVPVLWILCFLGVFLAVFIKGIDKVKG